jgi:hypothetical protein
MSFFTLRTKLAPYYMYHPEVSSLECEVKTMIILFGLPLAFRYVRNTISCHYLCTSPY